MSGYGEGLHLNKTRQQPEAYRQEKTRERFTFQQTRQQPEAYRQEKTREWFTFQQTRQQPEAYHQENTGVVLERFWSGPVRFRTSTQ